MSATPAPGEDHQEPQFYQIRLKGHLENRWADWFAGLIITREDNGETLLTGLLDQAALHSVLRRVRDLALPLLSVTRVRSGQADAPGVRH